MLLMLKVELGLILWKSAFGYSPKVIEKVWIGFLLGTDYAHTQVVIIYWEYLPESETELKSMCFIRFFFFFNSPLFILTFQLK